MVAPLLTKLAGVVGAGTALSLDNKKEREKIKKMMEKREEQVSREKEDEKKRETRGMKSGGKVSASKRADGCAVRGKTRGKMV